MKHPDKTRVRYEPHKHRDQTHAGHTGVVIFYTTDCWHRVRWDDPNPDPSFFNLGTVFRPEELVAYSNTKNLIVDTKANCPRCEVSWLGSEIAEEHRHHYGGATHGSRLIGMEDRDIYDGAHSWMCPDCRAVFPRLMEYHAKWKLKMLASGSEIIWGCDDPPPPPPLDTSKLCRPDGGRDGSGMFM